MPFIKHVDGSVQRGWVKALLEKVVTLGGATKEINLTPLCENTSPEGYNLLLVEDNTGPYAESDLRIPRTLYY